MTPPPDWLKAGKALLAAVTKGDGSECYEGSDERGAYHAVGSLPIPADNCPACALRRAVIYEEVLRENARIRGEPFAPVRTHDAQGVRRTGYKPEQEDEGEG